MNLACIHAVTGLTLSFILRPHIDHDSDSDSDLSLEDDQSGSYASTHSSDSEDEEGPLSPGECWENLASNGAKKPQLHGKDACQSQLTVGTFHVLSKHLKELNRFSSFWGVETFTTTFFAQ